MRTAARLLRRRSSPSVSTIARVTSQDARAEATQAGAPTVNWPAPPAQGDLLICAMWVNVTSGAPTLSIPGWVSAAQAGVNTNARRVAILYKVAGVGEPTAVTPDTLANATAYKLMLAEYAGTLTSNVLDQANAAGPGNNTNTNVTSRQAGDVTTTQARELVYCVCGTNGTIAGPSWDGGMAVRQQSATLNALFDGDLVTTSAGLYRPTAGWATARAASVLVATFKGA